MQAGAVDASRRLRPDEIDEDVIEKIDLVPEVVIVGHVRAFSAVKMEASTVPVEGAASAVRESEFVLVVGLEPDAACAPKPLLVLEHRLWGRIETIGIDAHRHVAGRPLPQVDDPRDETVRFDDLKDRLEALVEGVIRERRRSAAQRPFATTRLADVPIQRSPAPGTGIGPVRRMGGRRIRCGAISFTTAASGIRYTRGESCTANSRPSWIQFRTVLGSTRASAATSRGV